MQVEKGIESESNSWLNHVAKDCDQNFMGKELQCIVCLLLIIDLFSTWRKRNVSTSTKWFLYFWILKFCKMIVSWFKRTSYCTWQIYSQRCVFFLCVLFFVFAWLIILCWIFKANFRLDHGGDFVPLLVPLPLQGSKIGEYIRPLPLELVSSYDLAVNGSYKQTSNSNSTAFIDSHLKT